MVEKDKNLNKYGKENEVSTLLLFSEKEKELLMEILSKEEIKNLEQKRSEKMAQEVKKVERKNKIAALLNQMYCLSDGEGFINNKEYSFYDEGDVIIASHEGDSRIFEFDGDKFKYNNRLPYREIKKIGNGYMGVLVKVSDDIYKTKVEGSEVYSIISNKGVKKQSLYSELKTYTYLDNIYEEKYIKNKQKVSNIYNTNLELLTKNIPTGFRVLHVSSGEVLFKKEQLKIDEKNFVVIRQGDIREEKRVGEYELKDSQIYRDYINNIK